MQEVKKKIPLVTKILFLNCDSNHRIDRIGLILIKCGTTPVLGKAQHLELFFVEIAVVI